MTLELFSAYVVATLILLAVPGPTIMLVISYALRHGRKTAAACVLGVGVGDATAATASLLGLGAILATSATLFSALKWIGAAYLFYLGLKMWLSKPEALEEQDVQEVNSRKIFTHAFIVTALNPKGIVFFMAFLPHFIATDAAIAPQLVLLGTTFVVLGVLNAAIYALIAAEIGSRLKSPSTMKVVNRLGGGFLMFAAAMTAGLRRAAA
ncbi:lysine exporter protein LysE/YggA [Roseibium sp. TrichSKD4]|uniref:LysE family translocator n=1 Tax=Roseibium sp. TrichSKD4 TaxID=744980 RepID=UPI0001E56A02|nr:LysE family translocator [Roseibium sp. TrichSKD4]EFO31076.1 lysine exporter protein LysE/YggA [Roseibium sp. TrichSKD4]